MIKVTKLNGDEFIINCDQIQMIEIIPEAKIVMMNKEFFIVKETPEEIIDKSIHYHGRAYDAANIVVRKRD